MGSLMEATSRGRLREEFIRLLEEDREFRYAVMGLLGIREIIERMDRLEQQMAENTKAIRELQRQVAEHSKAIRELQKQVAEHSRAIRELQKQVAEHSKAIRGLQKQVMEHTMAIRSLQEQIERMNRRIDALGARWGLIAEETFREALKRFLKEYFKVARIEKVKIMDEEGYVYGYPCQIEYDIIIKDNIHNIVEIKSSTSRGDIAAFYRKCKLYEKVNKVKTRRIIVTCYADKKARELAEKLGIEVVTY